ncbi:decaprenyl-phosphate phosphoribosyltransferase [Nocardiopsis dassonvillei]|uniref:decaprenyl-phosphate phosphoribosyltransferase n=1 Tax=Nocardiopsis dassonvillei TaxID=2014 RepID=UPI00102B590A|nr:decaprenyl-phosphate phosphoribosyltransferase [Nocardiopsis dassonvillei]MCP3016153.1 decaprenyl-phosphate phosphoribosyltransferase [Nocardiopsis dassonvillei]
MTERTRATGPAAAGAPRGDGGTVGALVRACRPRQWLKNLLVLAAPAAAGALTQTGALLTSAAVFALFCAAASGTYLLNDVHDARRDRAHPRKRHRPVASGALPVPVAVAVGTALSAAAPLASLALGDPVLSALVAGYVLLTLVYTRYLRDLVVCDLVAVAACHVLRAVAGGVAVGVPLTSWFVIVVSLAALLVVVGKREAELRASGAASAATVGNGDAPGGAAAAAAAVRPALRGYSTAYLSQTRTMASGAMIVTYCLWALEPGDGPRTLFHALSIVPFIMFVLRYNLLVDRGVGEEPEEIALRDRPLQLILCGLAVLVGTGIHL